MIAIGIILIVLIVFVLAGLVSISSSLETIVKHQNEIIKVLKNSKK